MSLDASQSHLAGWASPPAGPTSPQRRPGQATSGLGPASARQRRQALTGVTRVSRPPRNLIADFERLVAEFPGHVHAARKLKVTDPKHDAVIRMALRGFSLTSKVYKWDAAHFAYVRRRALQHYESLGEAPLLFFGLAAGYALGLAAELELTKAEFRVAETHLDDTIRLQMPALRSGLISGLAMADSPSRRGV